MSPSAIVQKLWNYCNVLPDDGMSLCLLNPAHPDGFGKAEFFTAMGFRRETWQMLADALRQVTVGSPVTKNMTSIHGHKYIVDGLLQAPSGRTAMVRTVWIVDTGRDAPRLITAYPREQEA